jgi:lipopolysaccharide biosynthesis glycosyltransferase
MLGIPANSPYFNSGVLVLNLALWRSEGITDRCVEYLKRFDETRVFNDQEAMNAVIFDKWSMLERRWNRQDPSFETVFPGFLKWRFRRLFGKEDQMKSGIIHYCGVRKPWEPGYLGQGRTHFYEVLDQTPWRGWRIQRKADFEVIWRKDVPDAAKSLVPRTIKQPIKDIIRTTMRTTSVWLVSGAMPLTD